jgi:hypothetical protein
MGSRVLPHLELERLVIPFGLVLIPPAAGLVSRQLRCSGPARRGAAAIVLALAASVVLAVHLEEVRERYGNMDESHRRRYGFMSGDVAEVVYWLRENTTTDARILLTYHVEERLPGGSAFLSALTGRPMVAMLPYLSKLGYGDFVSQLSNDPARIRAELELLNIRHLVVAPEDANWLAGPVLGGQLHRRASWPEFAVYETDFAPSYLLGATGSVRFDYNRIEVRLDTPREEVVLKFRGQPGLFAVPPLPLEPAHVGALVPLIRVRPGNVRAFEIRY